MTLRELLQRSNGDIPGRYYVADDLEGGGDDENLETDEEREAREQAEAEAAEAAEAQARYDADVQAAAQKLNEEAIARREAELRQRFQPQQAQDPAEMRRQRLQAITEEFDPVKQEEMRLQLAKEELASQFAPQLQHSAYQGAIQSVLMHERDIPDNVKPFVEQAIRDYNVRPEQVATPEGAKQVRRIATGLAYENGAFDAAAVTAPRTSAPRPAPAPSGAMPTGVYKNLTDQERKVVERNMSLAGAKPGQKPEDIFSQREIIEMLAEVR